MNDSWLNLTDEEREEKIFNIAKEKTGLTNFNKYGVFYKFLQVIVSIVNNIYALISALLKQTNLDQATGEFLNLWGLLIGCVRKVATKTERRFLCHSFSSGTIPAGTFINVIGTNLRFKTTKDTTFNANEQFYIDVIAELPGSMYNISNNYQIDFSKVIYGIDSLKIPEDNGYIIQLGTDEEDDETYRQRIKSYYKSLNENLVKAKYIKIALEVPGVLDVTIIRAPRGGGSVDVVIAISDGFSSTDVIYNVTQKLYDYEVICRDLIVRECTKKLIDLNIHYSANFSESYLRAKVETFFNKQKIGKPVLLASTTENSLYSYLLNELDFEYLIINPNQNIYVSQYEIAKINNLEIIKDA